MPKRTSPGSAAPLRVVIVTMDSHLSGAAARAEAVLRREMPGLTLVVHAADEWGTDAVALEACRADIARADIVVAAMLFLDDHVRAVLPSLAARRDKCDAMVCCLSAGEVVRLTRLGKLDMAGEATGALALLKRLRGKQTGQGSSGRGQMRMLRHLPRLLRFIPGTAQDLRAYFLCIQYWLAGSEENLANMVRLLVDRFAGAPRHAPSGKLRVGPPVAYPDVGLYHPRAAGRIVDRVERLPAAGAWGTVGVLVMRSYVLAGNAAHYDGVIAALEARGLRAIPAFASGLDSRPAIERYFLRDGVPVVDAIVSLTGFSLVGGPAYNDARAAETILARLDVPYFAAHSVEFQTIEQWQADARGLMPVEATMMVAIPELDGAIGPITFGGRSSAAPGEDRRNMIAHPDRVEMLVARVARFVALRQRAASERRVAIVLFNFPPNGGSTGTAAYLSVFESLLRTLKALRAQGYSVDVPDTVEALRRRVVEGNAARFGTAANVAARIPADDHVRNQRWLDEIERQWGPTPGRIQTDGRSIFVLGENFGNVFVGLQPAFGYEGDPMRMMFERGFAPTHAFAAFYRWIRDEFRADAVLHFGTHGALEFMPGKHAGLSGECWPDRLIGDLPNFNLYAANNPSEGAIAKRRAAATLISYLTPPVSEAGLHRGLVDLKGSIDRWRQMPPDTDPSQRVNLVALIQSQAAALDLAATNPAWSAGDEARVIALDHAVLELEHTLIPTGLHVFGEPPNETERAAILDAAGVTEAAQRRRVDALLATDHEMPALLHALDGGYIAPAPGGDLVRNPEVLPTGRNLHGFDPFRIPSAFAVRDGARQADRLLARHAAEGGGLPETIAIVLWGTDNLKSEGGPISQVLWLLGAEPRYDGYGRLAGAQLVPLDRLGRPRVDVVVTLSGIFRDLLPLQTKLIAEAALLAASADEPTACNFVRKHALKHQAETGEPMSIAALRVFGNADGTYGANVNLMLDHGAWNDENELAEAFVRRKGFAYGVDGPPARRDAVFASLLSQVDVAYQNLDSIELGVTTVDHYFDTLGGIARAVRRGRGNAAALYIGDQTRGDGTVRTLSEQISIETHTRALNPKWYQALLEHGYEGVRQIEAHVTNTLGWSATTGQVGGWVYQQLAETYVLDDEMRQRIADLNTAASSKLVGRLIEAHERKYWNPDPATIAALNRASEEFEDRLEGIAGERIAA